MSEAKRFRCDNCDESFETVVPVGVSCPLCGSSAVAVAPERKRKRKQCPSSSR